MAYAMQRMTATLKQYPTFEAFDKGYTVTDNTFTSFLVYATKTMKEMDSDEIKRSKANIKLYIKATAARFKWGEEAYYKVINRDDVTLKAAVAAL
jgi:carboxyl-terminal processing protease